MSSLKHSSAQRAGLPSTRLLLVAAAFGATVTLNAAGAIIYSGVQNLSVPQSPEVFWVDLHSASLVGGGMSGHLALVNEVQEGVNQQYALTPVPGSFVSFSANQGVYLAALSAGFHIDASSVGPLGHFYGTMAAGPGDPNAQFNEVTDRYIGLSFVRDEALYYAWVRVSVNNAAGSLIVHDWAYESSGAGIQAGAIPTPSALALLAAAGVAGLWVDRGRRR
jgi:hypothetical protein